MADSLRRRMMMGQSGEDYSKQYLTFTVGGNYNCRFKYTVNGLVATTNMQYSLDDGMTWVALASGTDTPEVSIGSSIMWKADGWTASNSNYITFSAGSGTSEGIIVSGNIMSLLYGDNFVGQTAISNNYQFYNLFNGYVSVSDASNLILPAMTLTQYCYSNMFRGVSLRAAPRVLPATTLATSCYASMFQNCSTLVDVASDMLPATTLEVACYSYMFDGCSSLKYAPELPATTLAARSYYYMFQNCSSLSYIKCLATNISATNCLVYWVKSVAATGTFVKDASMTSWPSGNNGIPSGWTVEDAT